MSKSFLQKISPLVKTMQYLARQAEQQYAQEVNAVIGRNCRDSEVIEHLLDGLLNFAFDARVLVIFKTLCRYYFEINPEATASYVHAYRDMWDERYSKGAY